MKFEDNIIRASLEVVHVIRTEEEMQAREEYNSHLWDTEREDFPKRGENLYSTPVRDVKIGEAIYSSSGKYITYRSE